MVDWLYSLGIIAVSIGHCPFAWHKPASTVFIIVTVVMISSLGLINQILLSVFITYFINRSWSGRLTLQDNDNKSKNRKEKHKNYKLKTGCIGLTLLRHYVLYAMRTSV